MTIQKEDKKNINVPWLSIIISWLIYLPLAYFIFAISLMAGDSGRISLGVSSMVLVVNLFPIVIMIFMTSKAIKKRNIIFAILPIPIIVAPVLFLSIIMNVISSMGGGSYKTNKIKAVSVPTKTHFVCSENLAIDLLDNIISITEVKIIKNSTSVGSLPLCEIENRKITYTGYYTLHPEKQAFYDKALKECKNIEGQTILDLYDLMQ